MTDPFRKLITDTYLEYCKSDQTYSEWADRVFICVVCESSMKRTSMNNHLNTVKHKKALKQKFNINSDVNTYNKKLFKTRQPYAMISGLYNRKEILNKLPVFKINLTTSYFFDFKEFCEIYDDSKRYIEYLKLLTNTTLAQLMSDHRLGNYCMYNMVDSGQIDNYGSLIPSKMKLYRPQKNVI